MKIKFINFIQLFLQLCAFAEAVLLSYAAILFCGSYLTGFIFLLATFVNIKAGILGLIGAVSAVFFALKIKIPQTFIRTGIFGCNAILIGLSWGHYFGINLAIIIVLVAVSYFSNRLILYLIEKFGGKYELPTLSVSFVVFAWLGIIIFKISGFTSGGVLAFNGIKYIENYLGNLLPFYFQIVCKTISFTFFQNSVLVGLLAFLGILVYSRISFLFAAATGAVLYIILHKFGFAGAEISNLGFNSIFASLAFGGFFLRLGFGTACFAFFAVFAVLFMSWASNIDLSYLKLPILAFPFNITALLLLSLLKLNPFLREKYDFQLIPLDKIKSPEENLKTAYLKKIAAADISLPFYGLWRVSQGHNGRYTHKGAGRYAWDFWVTDGSDCTFKPFGIKVEDYYSFGLPVTAPCGGKVIETVNNIHDNPVGRPNDDFPWGNYVILEHNGIYAEISHFKCGSIIVKKSDTVVKGQMIGCCGNSGRSYQPHIHFQIQKEPTLGALSENFKLSRFIKLGHDGEKIEINKAPQEGDLVRNFGDDFTVAAQEGFFTPIKPARALYKHQVNKRITDTVWRVEPRYVKSTARGEKIKQARISCGYNSYLFADENGFMVSRSKFIFAANSLSRFVYGFYKIPKFLKPGTIWVLEENNINWTVSGLPFIKTRKNVVKNKYIGRDTVYVNEVPVNTHVFTSNFLINDDIWAKQAHLSENMGLVKMSIFKNGALVEELELKEIS